MYDRKAPRVIKTTRMILSSWLAYFTPDIFHVSAWHDATGFPEFFHFIQKGGNYRRIIHILKN